MRQPCGLQGFSMQIGMAIDKVLRFIIYNIFLGFRPFLCQFQCHLGIQFKSTGYERYNKSEPELRKTLFSGDWLTFLLTIAAILQNGLLKICTT